MWLQRLSKCSQKRDSYSIGWKAGAGKSVRRRRETMARILTYSVGSRVGPYRISGILVTESTVWVLKSRFPNHAAWLPKQTSTPTNAWLKRSVPHRHRNGAPWHLRHPQVWALATGCMWSAIQKLVDIGNCQLKTCWRWTQTMRETLLAKLGARERYSEGPRMLNSLGRSTYPRQESRRPDRVEWGSRLPGDREKTPWGLTMKPLRHQLMVLVWRGSPVSHSRKRNPETSWLPWFVTIKASEANVVETLLPRKWTLWKDPGTLKRVVSAGEDSSLRGSTRFPSPSWSGIPHAPYMQTSGAYIGIR